MVAGSELGNTRHPASEFAGRSAAPVYGSLARFWECSSRSLRDGMVPGDTSQN